MRRPAWRVYAVGLPLALLLAACSSSPPAPVIDKSNAPGRQTIPVDGLYRVRGGDSLHAIAFKYGLDYRDIATWNRIRSPYTIFPDQILRLTAPPRSAASSKPATSTRKKTTSPASKPPAPKSSTASRPAASSSSTVATANPSAWAWPTDGRVLRTFKEGDPARNGLDLAGREGQSVMATAAGEVVYSGDGLIGYGQLVIIKHSEQMLSAYAHNRKRLVSEGARVKQGQKIAELGRNDRNEQLLHFEIRLNGKPVNPLNYLPKQ